MTCFRIRVGDWWCAAGDYPTGDLRDWYYNTPPDVLTGEVMILDAAQAAAFGGTPWGFLVITEDDGDGTCRGSGNPLVGNFPTAWNPGPFAGGLNDDEFVGEITLGDPQTANNVSFQGVATMSFLRRY